MKKVYLLIIALAFSIGLKPQQLFAQAPDFTVPDLDGNEIHLYDILDRGQAVLIDFFSVTCETCPYIMPMITEAYRAFGCNQHDVFFIEVADGFINNHDNCLNWANTYGVEFPTICGTDGGTDIFDQYVIMATPTIVLITPDHQVAIYDLWPIESTEDIINALEAHGIEQHSCGDVIEETLTLSADTLYFDGSNPEGDLALLQVTNNTAEPEVTINGFETLPIGDQAENDTYYILYDSQEYEENDELNITIPQGQTIDLYVGQSTRGTYGPYYTKITFNNTLEDVSVIASSDIVQSVGEENVLSLSIFPNPAQDEVTLSGEILGLVSIYNAMGQKIEEIHAEGQEIKIPVSQYPNGMYFVKPSQGEAQRFMIAH